MVCLAHTVITCSTMVLLQVFSFEIVEKKLGIWKEERKEGQ